MLLLMYDKRLKSSGMSIAGVDRLWDKYVPLLVDLLRTFLVFLVEQHTSSIGFFRFPR